MHFIEALQNSMSVEACLSYLMPEILKDFGKLVDDEWLKLEVRSLAPCASSYNLISTVKLTLQH